MIYKEVTTKDFIEKMLTEKDSIFYHDSTTDIVSLLVRNGANPEVFMVDSVNMDFEKKAEFFDKLRELLERRTRGK